MTDNFSPADLLDLDRYPIADIHNGFGNTLAVKSRREFLDTGLCMLPGFLNTDALEKMAAEADAMQGDAYFCKSTHNAYLDDTSVSGSTGRCVSNSASENDATVIPQQTHVGSVPYDKIHHNSLLNQLYLWDPLKNFIGYVLGKESFHRFADPFGACSINVFVHGGEHGWHFDESEYTVTLMLQKPDTGGTFEYVPQIRGLDNENELVANILNGDRTKVVELPFTEGTLLIFGGKQTIHRVTRVSGNKARLVPVLCYSEAPDAVNSESVRKLFWGRSGPQDTYEESVK